MDSLNPLRVNTRRLLNNALCGGWHSCCVKTLIQISGTADPFASELEMIRRLPASFAFAALRDKVVAAQLLDVIDALECNDTAPTSGRLLLAMASRFFLPKLPEEHLGYVLTAGLLAVLKDYLNGKVKAEAYIGSAYNYRSEYGTSITAAGTDSEYELLFEAMPANGLDCPAGSGCWNLAMHWQSFGRFLASRRDEWRLLDDIDDELDTVALLEDVAASREAAEAVRTQIIDLQRLALAEGELDALDDELEALIEQFFPAKDAPEMRYEQQRN